MDKQCKLGKRLLAVVLAVVLVYGSAGTLGAVPAAAAQSGDDGTTNWGFIVPVTHQTTVPAGYTGIYTAQDLDNIRNDVDRWGYISDSYILMNNIDLGDYANWEPIGSIKYERDNSINFGGVFDGNGYEITSLKISQNLYENLSGTNPYVQYVIGLFGFANYNSTIKNLAVSYNITVSASTGGSTYIGLYVGGLTGSGSTIVNCTSSGTLSATSTATRVTFNLGGIAASADSIIDCVNKASITYRTGSESSTIGGISAYSGTIDGCFNIGNISVQSSSVTEHAGGITGSANTITNCKNSGTIKAYGYAGGITGTASNTQNCSNEGIISALCAGGIAGDGSLSTQTVTIMDCNNAGAVSGSFAGGIIGDTRKATCLVSACANTGGIQASIYGGGIVGTSSYTASNIISACYNAGKITTNGSGTYNVAGGILGYNNSAGSISGCFNIGHVTATNSYSYGMAMSGGIVGMGGAICANVYNKGFVESNATAEAYAGGIVGFYAKSIENSYNAGKISATSTQIDAYGNPLSKAGGILGINPSGTTGVIINKAYWLNTTTAVGIGETGDVSFNTVSLTDTQMRQQASFVGFDFDGVWDIDPDKNEGYPFLQSMVVPEGGGDDPDDPNATIDPNLDWWGFPNLTSQNITQELFQRVFGKKKGDKYYNDCIKDGSYNDGSGGHCFGMAATTAAINQNNPAVSTFAQGQHEHLATVKLTDKSVGLGLSAS
ncbi:MAG: hypothetical protein FWC25_00120, partial [Dehalococcoidia bacterium]|nr:hypothetical protein [Dehalococcoidia bacterium]